MAISCWRFYPTTTHRYIVHSKPPLTGRRAAMQFNIAEDLIITDRKTYARHRRNNILVDIEFYVSDVFDVTILEIYVVSNYRLNDRLANSFLLGTSDLLYRRGQHATQCYVARRMTRDTTKRTLHLFVGKAKIDIQAILKTYKLIIYGYIYCINTYIALIHILH